VAAALHADTALVSVLRGERERHAEHVLVVRRLLQGLHRWERTNASQVPGSRIAARDLYFAIAAAQLGMGAVVEANALIAEFGATELGQSIGLGSALALAEYSPREMGLDRSLPHTALTAGWVPALLPVREEFTMTPAALVAEFLREYMGDWQMLFLAGCAQESLPVVLRQSDLDRKERRVSQALGRASSFLRDAHSLRPDDASIQLRLGRTLLLQGRAEEALPLLESAASKSAAAGDRYLGSLFLGQLHAQRGDLGLAIDAFRKAVDLTPEAQTAHIALAEATERESGYAASRAILMPFLEAADPAGSGSDPWVQYPLGPEEFRFRPMDQLRSRITGR
jgi:tetratricopeptide (TPR) repeat protein